MALEDLFPNDRKVSKFPLDQGGLVEFFGKLVSRSGTKPEEVPLGQDPLITAGKVLKNAFSPRKVPLEAEVPKKEKKATTVQSEQLPPTVQAEVDKAPKPDSFLTDALDSVPVWQAGTTFFEVVGDAYERYEAARLAQQKALAKGEGLGEGTRAFIDAAIQKRDSQFTTENSALKGSNTEQFGDIYRQMGFAELPSAVMGFLHSELTDPLNYGLLFGPAILKGVIKGGKAIRGLAEVPESTVRMGRMAGFDGVEEVILGDKKVAEWINKNVFNPAEAVAEKFKNFKNNLNEFMTGQAMDKSSALGKATAGLDDYITKTLKPQLENGVEFINTKTTGWMEEAQLAAEEFIKAKGLRTKWDDTLKNAKNQADILATKSGAKAAFLALKSNREVAKFVDMMLGKTADANLDPKTAKIFAEALGEQRLADLEGQYFANLINRHMPADYKGTLHQTLRAALKGHNESFDNLHPELQAAVKHFRTVTSGNSDAMVESLGKMGDAEIFRLAEEFGADTSSRLNAINGLMTTFKNNENYLTQGYKLFNKEVVWEPLKDTNLTNRAINEIVNDWGWDEQKALDYLENLVAKANDEGGVYHVFKKAPTDHLKQKKPIGPAVRAFLGEETDPRVLMAATLKNQAELRYTWKAFEYAKEAGIFVPSRTSTHTKQIKGQGLQWGIVDGMWTDPVTADWVTLTQRVSQENERWLVKWFQNIKGLKVFLSPKAMGHQILGNTMIFAPVSGFNPITELGTMKESFGTFSDMNKILAGKLPRTHPAYEEYTDWVRRGFVGNEIINADDLRLMNQMIDKPWSRVTDFRDLNTPKEFVQWMARSYGLQDSIYKVSTYKMYLKQGMTPDQATAEVFKWWPNPQNASKFAQEAKQNTASLMFFSPFLTFQSEQHRVWLNIVKHGSPQQKFLWAMMSGSRLAWNTVLLGAAGHGLGEVMDILKERPELVSEVYLNPLDPTLDVNVKYIDPFNTSGLFAPLLALSGAQGVNMFDYLTDFTQFSPEFGHSNFMLQAIEPILVGKDKYGQELTAGEKLFEFMNAHLSTSFTRDAPNALNKTDDPKEQRRRAMRFFGFDVQDRDPSWVRRELTTSLKEKVKKGEEERMRPVLEFMGYDADAMIEKARKNQEKEDLKALKNKVTSI